MDTVIKIGDLAPDFHLQDLQGELHDLASMRGWIVVLNFWSSECDWCERVDRELVHFLPQWREHVKVLWIASNANESQVLNEKTTLERNLATVLLDSNQVVADRYDVQTTPHFFVVDNEGKLRYQGAWDDITFRQRTATQKYVQSVVEALMQGQAPEITQTQPYGCMLLRFS